MQAHIQAFFITQKGTEHINENKIIYSYNHQSLKWEGRFRSNLIYACFPEQQLGSALAWVDNHADTHTNISGTSTMQNNLSFENWLMKRFRNITAWICHWEIQGMMSVLNWLEGK